MVSPNGFGSSRSQQMWQALPMIALAGILFWCSVVCIALIVVTVVSVNSGDGFAILTALVYALPTLCGSAAVSFIIYALLGAMLLAAMEIFNRSLGHALRPQVAGALIGGLAGYFGSLWVVPALFDSRVSWWWSGLILSVPVFGALITQVASYYGVRYFQTTLVADCLVGEAPTPEKISALLERLETSDAKSWPLDLEELPLQPAKSTLPPPPSVHPLDQPDDWEEPVAAKRSFVSYFRAAIRPQSSSSGELRARQWTIRQTLVLTGWLAALAAIIAAIGQFSWFFVAFIVGFLVCEIIAAGFTWALSGIIKRRVIRKTLLPPRQAKTASE